jgi:hypothetical protein
MILFKTTAVKTSNPTLDISQIINLLIAQIISLIFDTFSSVVEVNGRPEHYSSSVNSAPP